MMHNALWGQVDEYFNDLISPSDHVLDHILQTSEQAGLPAISISEAQGKFLYMLAGIQGARRILEIGTLAGYSAVWMARAMPEDGQLVTLEFEQLHADVAMNNFKYANLTDKIELRTGSALDTLPQIAKEMSEKNQEPFDMVFIDADKPNYVHYFDWALKLCRVGSVIISDNVVRRGEVINPQSADVNVPGIRTFNETVSANPRVTSVVLQTVGSKGYDGFMLSRVVA